MYHSAEISMNFDKVGKMRGSLIFEINGEPGVSQADVAPKHNGAARTVSSSGGSVRIYLQRKCRHATPCDAVTGHTEVYRRSIRDKLTTRIIIVLNGA